MSAWTRSPSRPPDGYSLGLGGIASHAIAPTLYAKLPFNPRTDFTFVSTIWQLPNMLVVNLDAAGQDRCAELIELLKKNPGKYSYGSAGSGTTLHLSGELFKMHGQGRHACTCPIAARRPPCRTCWPARST